MGESAIETKKKILDSAMAEFLEKGFMNASLRTIASNAGLTTGAMYRHFKDKDALFCALVDDAIDMASKAVMMADVSHHLDLHALGSKEHFEEENKQTSDLLNYIFEHFQEEICDLYTKNCEQLFNWMYKNQISTKKIDKMTTHFIASTVINAFMEIITHKMSKKAAFQYMENIMEFTRYGMMHMLGFPCELHEAHK